MSAFNRRGSFVTPARARCEGRRTVATSDVMLFSSDAPSTAYRPSFRQLSRRYPDATSVLGSLTKH
jgi:hypothetical protein